ncbi:influenza virus NS1A-binding protein homolog B-like [Papilio machaon]|uniref:influenza virus NS1A-binding protein homolog B-like n=1 Tax=Papilio machaon TaxID=76193 RepID=UPI001E6653C4|nr:influenza virus NS1A-binding protein homolog B-like [Papilio machaon]
MKPHDDGINGHESGGSAASGGARSDDSEGEEAALEEELSLVDEAAPARVLAALNALRKARQHYDVLLAAGAGGAGEEVAAHRAVLAAVSPRLLAALPATPPAAAPAAPALRLPDVDAEALRELVEYAYTGRLRVRDAAGARRLYRAAARLRVETARAHLAERLVRRPAPHDALAVRALPDLQRHHRAALDAYIAEHFDEICACGALAALPLIHIEMLRETSAERGQEAPAAVAGAALTWLRDQLAAGTHLEDLCSRPHLLFVDAEGALRDCGELPASGGDAPELHEYRREAAERERGVRRRAAERERAQPPAPPAHSPDDRADDDTGVLAARAAPGAGVTRALLALKGKLAAARIAWRTGSGSSARGGRLGGAVEPGDAPRLAPMSVPRCALGAAELGGRLLVCGGYDRARVLRCAEAYDPDTNTWTALPDMRSARGRFPAAVLGGALYALGGSDGHAELDSVDAFGGGAWERRARLPLARSHAAAAADEEAGVLYVAGGWAAGRCLRQVHRYSPLTDTWTEAPPLNTGRSQCAGVMWQGEPWVLGGCDAWHCLAGTERLRAGGWAPGPALPTARRSVGGAVWRGRLVAAGGSSGGASLRTTAWLEPDALAWREGPLLREARAAPALCVVRDVLYCAGGFSGQEFLASVECLLEPDGCWTALWVPHSPAAPAPATQILEEQILENHESVVVNGSHDVELEREDEMGARCESERDGALAKKSASERGGALERDGESGAVGGA